MKTITSIICCAVLAVFCFTANSCCNGGVSYEGKFATYTVDEHGNIIIEPRIHSAK